MIVIDENANEAVRTGDPNAVLRGWILRQLSKGETVVGVDGDVVTPETVDWHLDQAGDDFEDVFSGFLVVGDDMEGKVGVAIGFSSADRQSFAMPWPEALEDDFLGNGDPTVYKTAGVPEGKVVKGEVEVLPE